MEQAQLILLAFVVVSVALPQYAEGEALFDVRKYGGGGDITAGLEKAWKAAIASPQAARILIPAGQWTLKQAHLEGPNKSPLVMEVQGTVKALSDPYQLPNKEFEWVTINYVNFFTLTGKGVFDGNGKVAWTKNDCHKNKKCMKLPINLSFNFINNSIIQDVTTKDSKNFHVNCISSHNVTFQRFKISAPAESPNTDGIHMGRSSIIKVLDSVIETGDDCISMGDQLTDVLIKNVKCGPGHGISIGSLGKNPDEKDVSRITVQSCTFTNTDNGIRIKTWPSAPATLKITDLTFSDLTMVNVSNPVIIDQQYCPWNLCSLDRASLIQISKVKIQNVKGTSSSQDVLIFACSSSKPCQDVQIGNIDLKFIGDPTLGGATTKCQNVKYTATGKQNPPLCVKSAAPKPLPMVEEPSEGEKKSVKKSEEKPEKKSEKRPEKMSEEKPEKKSEKKPEKKSEEKPAEKKPEKKSEKKPTEKKSEKKSEENPAEKKSEKKSKKKPEKKSEEKPAEKKPEKKSEKKPEKNPGKKAEKKHKKKVEKKSEKRKVQAGKHEKNEDTKRRKMDEF